jgi:diadenosine tetraphosphate (Ap4A) HIT family hydrolase
MPEFELHPRLRADCSIVGQWPLCKLLLMNDARYPWFILVPSRSGLRELCELSAEDTVRYMQESRQISEYLLGAYRAEKLNVAALGNVVPQLHIHHIARYAHDAAWPAPVWGAHPPLAYTPDQLSERLAKARQDLAGLKFQP